MNIRKVKNRETREKLMIVLQDMVPNPWNAPSEGKPIHHPKENQRIAEKKTHAPLKGKRS